MGIRKNDLVKFKDDRMYQILDVPKNFPLIVIRGPYEGRNFKPGQSTSLAIVVDLMAGNRIVEKIKVNDIERFK